RLRYQDGAWLTPPGAAPDVHESGHLPHGWTQSKRHVVDPGRLPRWVITSLLPGKELRVEHGEAGHRPRQLYALQEDPVDGRTARRPSPVHLDRRPDVP